MSEVTRRQLKADNERLRAEVERLQAYVEKFWKPEEKEWREENKCLREALERISANPCVLQNRADCGSWAIARAALDEGDDDE